MRNRFYYNFGIKIRPYEEQEIITILIINESTHEL